MESFVMNGFSLMLFSFCSYYLLAWWVRAKNISQWVTYMNALTLAWVLGSFTYLLPDLLRYSAQTRVGAYPLCLTGLVLTLCTVYGVKNNRKYYGRPDKGFRQLLFVGGLVLVGTSNLRIFEPSQLLNIAIALALTIVLLTAISYVKYLRKLSTSALYYLLSSISLFTVLLFFWQEWERNFSIFVLCGALMLQIVGYAVFYLEHMYIRNLQVKLEEKNHVQKRQAEESRSYYLENFDSVTQLRNQVNLQRKFGQWQLEKEQQWLMLLNITNFRQYNNHFGYQEGNQLLKQLADWLVRIAEQERSVYRFENDVFLIRYKGNQQAASRMAEGINRGFMEHFSIKCDTATMGLQICLTPIKPHLDLETHIQELSIARSMSDQGEFFSFYDDSRVEAYRQQMDLQKDIREAVRDRQFLVYYQPKVFLENGQLMGAEALVRMNGANGIVSPGVFMDYAESSGLIKDIGYMVIDSVFAHLNTYHFSFPVSINLSAIQLFDSGFIDSLESRLHQYGINAQQITLEITETAVMKHYEEGIRKLRQLRDLGFKVSLDDFGTGYSSFAYLMDMPIHELKVDRSLVRNIAYQKKQQILMKTLVNLSRDLEVALIIEGVETNEQREMLMGLGGTIGQGYLFDKPMPVQDFVLKYAQNN